ncbi:MAG TPA: NADP-dependent phosphogluconate dehydrogenase [Candidatus Peribacteraceae bacterium]|nr:NADP-dependent phosphogluconate dehydrogenase [Candidatus Peribacteraceae bacterium]
MQLGVIGLSTMGSNLARNAARNGAHVAVFNRTTSKMDAFMKDHGGEGDIVGCKTPEEFCKALSTPRAILIMVKAGQPVDDVIEEFMPFMDKGDIFIDGGNSHYTDSERREKDLEAKGFRFIGMGVSGGEEGALFGPSMMPGGDKSAYDELAPLLQKMAADDGDGGKCVEYIGPGGAGHFVKMVHNGIEYGDMQLIAETYHLLGYVAGLDDDAQADVFAEWNNGDDLHSFLIEITAKVLRKKDPDTGKQLVDVILDSAGSKGTGKWTSQSALDLGVMIPTITAAVDARYMSAHKEERIAAAKALESYDFKVKTPGMEADDVRHALFLSKICSYAQGMALIAAASEEYGWKLQYDHICRIWKGGCIIRSTLLKNFEQAFAKNPGLKNLLLDDELLQMFRQYHQTWRKVIADGIEAGVPLPAMCASLAYFDGYFTERLPQNLTQAQRDFFGAHTYQRIDKDGTFHTEWE